VAREIKEITLIRGDGIGPEVIGASLEVLDALGLKFQWDEQLAGTAAIEKTGAPLPPPTLESIRRTKMCFKGPLATPSGGGYKSVNVTLRQELDLFANVRPAKTIPGVPLSRFDDVDIVIVRENTQGMYSGIDQWADEAKTKAEAISVITKDGSARLIRFAFEYARKNGRKKITVAHKANILKLTSGLFLATAREIAPEFPDIEFGELIIDNCCMQLVKDPSPKRFDMIVTTNLFGDILSDLTAGLVGGLGLAPGMNVGYGSYIFEAVHGTAPDIAGKGLANPAATMSAAVMMLDALDQKKEADRLEKAIREAIQDPATRTKDLPGGQANTAQFTKGVIAHL
jgi:isocitrate dehydrogenase (NAD+)